MGMTLTRSLTIALLMLSLTAAAFAEPPRGPAAPAESAQQKAFYDALLKYKADLAAADGMRAEREAGRAFHDAWDGATIEPFVMELVNVSDQKIDINRGTSVVYKGETKTRKWLETKRMRVLTLRSRFGETDVTLLLERRRIDTDTNELIEREAIPKRGEAVLEAAKPGESVIVGQYVIDDLGDARWGRPIRLGLGEDEPFEKGEVIGAFQIGQVMTRDLLDEHLAKASKRQAAAEAEQKRREALIEASKRLHPELASAESPDQAAWFDALLAYDQAVRGEDASLGDRRDAGKAFQKKWAGKTIEGFGIELTRLGALERKQSGSVSIKDGEVTNYKVNELSMAIEGRTSFGPVKMRLVFDRTKTRTADGKVIETTTNHEHLRKTIKSAEPGDRLVLDWTLGDLDDFRWGKPLDERLIEFDDRDRGEEEAGNWVNLRLVKKAALEGP